MGTTDTEEPTGIDLDAVAEAEEQEAEEREESEPEREAAPSEPAERPKNSRQRRAENHRQLKEELEQFKSKYAEIEGKYNGMAGYVQQMSERLAFADKRQPEGDPHDAELDDIHERQQAIYMRIQAGNVSQAELDRLEQQARKLDRRKYEVTVSKELKRQMPQQAQPQQDPHVLAMQMQYPDIYANPRAITWAEGYARQQMAITGRPMDLGMVRESFEQARKQFATRPPAPSASAQSKYTGAARGQGGSSGGNNVVTMNKAQKRMAEALYSDLPPEKAHVKWAKGPGKRMLEASRK